MVLEGINEGDFDLLCAYFCAALFLPIQQFLAAYNELLKVAFHFHMFLVLIVLGLLLKNL